MKTKRILCSILAALMLAAPMTACTSGSESTDTTGGDTAATVTGALTEAPTEAPTEEATEAETEEPVDRAGFFFIQSDSPALSAAAYTLYESFGNGMLLALPGSDVATPDSANYIRFVESSADEVGNYGYSIERTDSSIIIKAASLAGADRAVARLLANTVVDGTALIFSDGFLPANTTVTEALNWTSDYVLEGNDYKPEYNAGMFYNDKSDSVAYVSNAMWHMFGLVDDGQGLVYRFGNEPTWYEWMSEKVAWSGNASYIGELKGKLRSFPQVSTGYMWSWGTFPYWKVDNCYSIHYDGTFRYIAAVYDVIAWEGSTDFLFEKDNDTAGGQYSSVDASKGRTVLDKTEACMNYILEYLHGKDGYIQLTEQSTYLNADGSERFDYVKDTGEYCWNNTGKDGSNASNYWDNLCFGGYDGYSGALFYNTLHSMAGIYRMLGGDYTAKAEQLELLAITVKEKFNELYWSEDTGRYIACIDTDGRKVDFGLTFHNFEIMKYGLADAERAKSIFDWVDGDRIIEGEERTGADIFSYSKIYEKVNRRMAKEMEKMGLRLAAVTNTIPINNRENQKLQKAWWHGPAGINVWGSASYGMHLENGGYIFYPVFYELMARTEYEGAQSTTDRLLEISRVYEFNRLVADAAAVGSTNWLEGLNGEFPESGLVPTTYLYSLVGVSASHDGLHLAPAFNDVYEYMGVKELKYGGKAYGVQVNRDGSCVITATNGTIDMTLHYTPERFSTVEYTVTILNADGTTATSTVTPDESGVIHVELKADGVTSVTVAPILK